ncbi:MAG: (5-formylfuran-3-yl)methyl phosphate synthase [Pseudomonadota bacterium]
MKQRLLISVRGKNEAIEALKGGANIIDVEYPASALGTPYPLNIQTVRKAMPKSVKIATNIGEDQQERRSTACQAVLGVAHAGADIIKAGLAGYSYKEAVYLGRNIIRTIKHWYPKKEVIPAVFADKNLKKIFNPIKCGPKLAKVIKADGILIDTFNKNNKQNKLTKLLTLKEIKYFVNKCHSLSLEAWIAGSITLEELPTLWTTGVDVICIRGAACAKSLRRMSKVYKDCVKILADTIPK